MGFKVYMIVLLLFQYCHLCAQGKYILLDYMPPSKDTIFLPKTWNFSKDTQITLSSMSKLGRVQYVFNSRTATHYIIFVQTTYRKNYNFDILLRKTPLKLNENQILVKHGVDSFFYRDTFCGLTEYKNGNRNGAHVDYFLTGNPRIVYIRSHYKNDNLDGFLFEYDVHGALIKKERYRRGKLKKKYSIPN